MIIREDENLQRENMGKLKSDKVSLDRKIKRNFAYIDRKSALDTINKHTTQNVSA